MTFIDRLLKLMHDKNITAYRLSKDIGISDSLISKWQKSKDIDPSSSTLYKISEYFHVSMEWLITGNDTNLKQDTSNSIDKQELDEDEIELLNYFNKLTTREKYILIGELKNQSKTADIKSAKSKSFHSLPDDEMSATIETA